MIKKNLTFFFILILISFIILLSYKKKEQVLDIQNTDSNVSFSSNTIDNVNYNYKDEKGNEYIINSTKGEFDLNDNNIIFLTDVSASLKLEDGRMLKISSDFGKYNTENTNTIFSKNVLLLYQENKIISDYLDFSPSRNNLIISKNVILKNKDNTLKADTIEFDMFSEMIKIFMHGQNEKVKMDIYN